MSYPSDLFRAIFTPGAPPALLLATNVSFALLQLTLLVMLFATYSYHFFFLSIMCAGVWGGINWFVREVERLQKVEEQATEIRRVQKELEKEEERRREVKEEQAAKKAKASGVEVVGEAERRKATELEEDEEDDFEKVEVEEGYETEGRKAK
ncbi:hypothetical protein ABW19_dt0202160 [Dactylella cylindrospora]|nr:hypothetical protein ABW19_dt0202160 [Dactylella cylindrospora]